ncbi:MAG TPA: RDD family protein [Candidatus Angelobacter sp.]|nr:RDD family protein [Candidatus Angelobacter sp.]
MFCSRCGLRVEEGNRFCQGCGQEVGAAVAAAPVAASALPPPYGGSAQVSAALPYAGFWERFAAYLIDGLILGIPFGIVVLLLIMTGVLGVTLHRSPVNPREAAALLGPIFLLFFSVFLALVVVQWLYFAVLESSARQATVGKSVMSLRVTNSEGQRISFGHATGRFFAKIVSGMVPLAIGYIMAAFTERKQALHDLIAGTLVLKR